MPHSPPQVAGFHGRSVLTAQDARRWAGSGRDTWSQAFSLMWQSGRPIIMTSCASAEPRRAPPVHPSGMAPLPAWQRGSVYLRQPAHPGAHRYSENDLRDDCAWVTSKIAELAAEPPAWRLAPQVSSSGLRCSVSAAALRSEGTTRRAILWLKVNVFKSEMADVDPDNCLNLVREYSEYPEAL
jgi:hypothetical protein